MKGREHEWDMDWPDKCRLCGVTRMEFEDRMVPEVCLSREATQRYRNLKQAEVDARLAEYAKQWRV